MHEEEENEVSIKLGMHISGQMIIRFHHAYPETMGSSLFPVGNFSISISGLRDSNAARSLAKVAIHSDMWSSRYGLSALMPLR